MSAPFFTEQELQTILEFKDFQGHLKQVPELSRTNSVFKDSQDLKNWKK